MELIDREATLKKMCETCGYCEKFEKAMRSTHPDFVTDKCNNYKFLAEQPTIEPEVRHGRWIEKPPYKDETVKGLEFQIVCSRCDEQNASIEFDDCYVPIAKTFYMSRFCPNCGAKMDLLTAKDQYRKGESSGYPVNPDGSFDCDRPIKER